MRKFLLIISLFLSACVISPRPTIVDDPAEAKLLLGEHKFSNMTLSSSSAGLYYTDFGKAFIGEKNEHYTLDAEHEITVNFRGTYTSGYLRAKGAITRIGDQFFEMKGSIVIYTRMYALSAIAKNKDKIEGPCNATGTFRFSRKNHPDFWLLDGNILCDKRWKDYEPVIIMNTNNTDEINYYIGEERGW